MFICYKLRTTMVIYYISMDSKQIELIRTNLDSMNRKTTTIRDSISYQEQSQQQSQAQQNKSKRRPQKLGLYILVVIAQSLTIFLSILLSLIPPEHKMYTYVIYMGMTVVRSSIFICSSYQLIGCTKKLILLYVLLDNTFLMELASIVTYIFLNYTNAQTMPIAIGALIAYPILLFTLVGNFRVMLKYCKWNKIQVIIYKIVKATGSTFFLIYGTLLIIKSEDNTQSDLFMLWVFTTCGFWGQMFFCINSFDASDGLSTKYELMDQ